MKTASVVNNVLLGRKLGIIYRGGCLLRRYKVVNMHRCPQSK